VLPVAIPIPPIAEVQQALASAAESVSGATGADLKKRMRTGTVVTTDDRNWELRYTDSALRFSQSRAIGIDMESATIAAQGYRFRTSRCTANSSCPDRRTVSTKKRSPPISRSASARAKRCATKVPSSTAVSCARSTSRPSVDDRARPVA